MKEFVTENAFAMAVLMGSAYLALGRWKNLREGKGCPRCETVQMWVALGLAAWSGWELWKAYSGR